MFKPKFHDLKNLQLLSRNRFFYLKVITTMTFVLLVSQLIGVIC